MIELPSHAATRYVQPLREGGSLPAVVDTSGAGLYVVKFRGAGQGAKALIAELIVGLLAAELGLPVPPLALVHVSDRFGRSEPDPEIQELLRRSHGVNVGMRYLDGAFNFDPTAAGDFVDAALAARIVWLDAFVTNPDRTHRNPNLLVHQRKPWLIDHGAALYAQHDWSIVDEKRARSPFPLISRHVLLASAADIATADDELAARITDRVVHAILDVVPDALLLDPLSGTGFASASEARARYTSYLLTRATPPRDFVGEAHAAHQRLSREQPRRLEARR